MAEIDPIIEFESPAGGQVFALHPLIRQVNDELHAELGRRPTLEEVAAEFQRRRYEFEN